MNKLPSAEIRDIGEKYISKAAKLTYFDMAFYSGEGIYIYDNEGNKYMDMLSSAGSQNLGYGNKEIADAAYEQMKRLPQVTPVYVHCQETALLAKKLCEISGGDYPKKVAWSCTGSAGIDGAMKFAKGYTGRTKTISFIGAYHGSTYGAISVSGVSLNMRRKMHTMPDNYEFSYPVCYRCKYNQDVETCNLQCLKEIEEAFDFYLPPEEVAAVFFEPVAGDAGIIVPPAKFVEGLAKLCKEHGILLVSDEIQQGFGRTGKWFGIDNFDVEADMIVIGKSAGAGLPLGAVIGRAEILDSLEAPAHLFTMGGTPVVAAAGLKMIEIIEREGYVENAKVVGTYFLDKLKSLYDKYDIVGNVRGIGLSLALEFVKDRASMEPYKEATLKVCANSLTEGLFMVTLGKSSLRIQPPIIMTKEQVDETIRIIDLSIQKFLNGEIPDETIANVKGW